MLQPLHNCLCDNVQTYDAMRTKPNLVAKIMATNFGNRLCIGYQNLEVNISSHFHRLVKQVLLLVALSNGYQLK